MIAFNPVTLLKNERIIHSLKTALAVLLGFVIIKSTHLPADQWLLITIIVVMCAQINVGGMIQKSIMRFFATLAGSLIAILTLFIFGNNTSTNALVIALSVMYFSYLATGTSRFNDAGTLGAATTVIILVNIHPTLFLGLQRTLEILAGIVIAAIVSQFILPIHARTHLRRDQVDTLNKLRNLYFENFIAKHKDPQANHHFILDEQIIKSLIAQRKLAIDAAREPFAKQSFIVKRFSDLLSCEREILRAIDFMHHAYIASPKNIILFSSGSIMHLFHERICATLEALANSIDHPQKNALSIDIPSTLPLQTAIHNETQLAEKEITDTRAFLFCAEVLLGQLQELVNLIKA
jgi:uncharacterized membrane protein YccC